MLSLPVQLLKYLSFYLVSPVEIATKPDSFGSVALDTQPLSSLVGLLYQASSVEIATRTDISGSVALDTKPVPSLLG